MSCSFSVCEVEVIGNGPTLVKRIMIDLANLVISSRKEPGSPVADREGRSPEAHKLITAGVYILIIEGGLYAI